MAQEELDRLCDFYREVLAEPPEAGAPAAQATSSAPPSGGASARAPPPPPVFLSRVDSLVLRSAGLVERAAMLAGRASRGRASEAPPPVRWGRVASVSQAGALVRAALSSAATLPESTASTFRRYKTALAAGSELALPFTADKIIGYLAVYCERWGQKSSSLKSVVMHLRAFADHFGFGWMPAAEEAVVEKARLHLELANPCEISHAAAVMEDGLMRMLHALDKLVGAGNLWALMLAALISLAHDAATRLNEPTHALRKDIKVSDEGLYLTTLFNKGSKRFQDARTQTARASARPGSSRCVVARVRAYLEAANLAPEALLFPRREPSTGALVLSATGAPMLYTEYHYKREFRALAAAAGIANAASLSPRGLRAGGAMDDRLAGLSSEELNGKIGWGAKKHAQPLYVRGNEIGLELDAAARATASRSRTR